jgi:AcrR family transcriptional regulator
VTAVHEPTAFSAWGHDPAPGAGPSGDRRVARTRARVLEHARRLLAEGGPEALTLSELAGAAGTSRQTLYRYWGTPAEVVVDLLLRRTVLPPTATRDPAQALLAHLQGLRTVLRDAGASAAYSLLIAAADRSTRAAEGLASVVARRRELLNATLAVPLDEAEYALLTGPVVYTHFVARTDVPDALLDQAVQAVLPRRR